MFYTLVHFVSLISSPRSLPHLVLKNLVKICDKLTFLCKYFYTDMAGRVFIYHSFGRWSCIFMRENKTPLGRLKNMYYIHNRKYLL